MRQRGDGLQIAQRATVRQHLAAAWIDAASGHLDNDLAYDAALECWKMGTQTKNDSPVTMASSSTPHR